MHIPRADLDQIHIAELIQLMNVHQLGADGQTGGLLCQLQQFQTLCTQSLKGIGGSTRFESTTAENGRTGLLHGIGGEEYLFFRFNRARAGDHSKMTTANIGRTYLYNGILRVKFSIHLFVGFGYALDPGNDLHRLQ